MTQTSVAIDEHCPPMSPLELTTFLKEKIIYPIGVAGDQPLIAIDYRISIASQV